MEIDDAFLTLLTPEGEFLRARKQNQTYLLGDEIHFFPIESISTNNSFNSLKRIWKQRTVWTAALAIIILFGSFIPMYQNNRAYAYMSIDGNSRIKLGINKKMQVVELTGLNKEGKKVISHLDNWEKKNVSQVTNTILAEIKDEGYLNKTKPVLIATFPKKNLELVTKEELKKSIQKIKKTVHNQHPDVTFVTGKEKDWENQSPVTNKGKEHLKTNASMSENKKNDISSQPSSPPGQLKKPEVNGNLNNKGTLENSLKQKDITNHSNGTSIPSTQWEKRDEGKIKQNQGYSKKQSSPEENSNQKRKNNIDKMQDKSKVKMDSNIKGKLKGPIKE
ncbi:anti-sigma factor domain-containing protein [Neobacillus pocheonensis]